MAHNGGFCVTLMSPRCLGPSCPTHPGHVWVTVVGHREAMGHYGMWLWVTGGLQVTLMGPGCLGPFCPPQVLFTYGSQWWLWGTMGGLGVTVGHTGCLWVTLVGPRCLGPSRMPGSLLSHKSWPLTGCHGGGCGSWGWLWGAVVCPTCGAQTPGSPQALDTYGGIDILVSNAAVNPALGPALDADESVWEKVSPTGPAPPRPRPTPAPPPPHPLTSGPAPEALPGQCDGSGHVGSAGGAAHGAQGVSGGGRGLGGGWGGLVATPPRVKPLPPRRGGAIVLVSSVAAYSPFPVWTGLYLGVVLGNRGKILV